MSTDDDDDDLDDDAESSRRRYLLQRFWQSGRQFWTGNDRRSALFLTGSLLVTIIVQIFIQYQLTAGTVRSSMRWRSRNARGRLVPVDDLPRCAIASVLSAVAQIYVRMTLQRRWRNWLNDHVLDRWLNCGRYYQLNLVSGEHENPEYRIAEDLRIATESPVDFVSGIMSAFAVGRDLHRACCGRSAARSRSRSAARHHVPGFLVVAAVVYAVIARARCW